MLDVDGTIAGADHVVTARTNQAMSALERLGVRVVLATGRSRGNVLDICRAADVRTPAVSCNGGIVTDPVTGRDLRVRAVPPDDMAAMQELHRRTGQPLTWWTARDIFVTSNELQDMLLQFGDPNVHLATPDRIEPGTVVKTMLFGSKSELDAITPDIRMLVPRAMRSMDQFWELSAPDASKWSAVKFVLDELGIDPAQVAGVGDGGNDVVWMREIGNPGRWGTPGPRLCRWRWRWSGIMRTMVLRNSWRKCWSNVDPQPPAATGSQSTATKSSGVSRNRRKHRCTVATEEPRCSVRSEERVECGGYSRCVQFGRKHPR